MPSDSPDQQWEPMSPPRIHRPSHGSDKGKLQCRSVKKRNQKYQKRYHPLHKCSNVIRGEKRQKKKKTQEPLPSARAGFWYCSYCREPTDRKYLQYSPSGIDIDVPCAL